MSGETPSVLPVAFRRTLDISVSEGEDIIDQSPIKPRDATSKAPEHHKKQRKSVDNADGTTKKPASQKPRLPIKSQDPDTKPQRSADMSPQRNSPRSPREQPTISDAPEVDHVEREPSFLDFLSTNPLPVKKPEMSLFDVIVTQSRLKPSDTDVVINLKPRPAKTTTKTSRSPSPSPSTDGAETKSSSPEGKTTPRAKRDVVGAPTLQVIFESSDSSSQDPIQTKAQAELSFDFEDFRAQVLLSTAKPKSDTTTSSLGIPSLSLSSLPSIGSNSASGGAPATPTTYDPISPTTVRPTRDFSAFVSTQVEQSPFLPGANETWESLHLRKHLEDPLGYFYFQECLKSHYAEENLLFFTACQALRSTQDEADVPVKAEEIYITFFAPGCVTELNVSHAKKNAIQQIAKKKSWSRIMYDKLCFETFRQLQQFWIQNYREDFHASIYYKNYLSQRMGLPLIPYEPPGAMTALF